MGAAIAAQLLADADHTLICISRHENASLDAQAKQSGATCEQ